MENKQLTFLDAVMGFSRRRKVSKAVRTLSEIDALVDWRVLAEIVSVLDRTQTGKGGRPPIGFEIKLKMMFLQYLFNLSDEELEDQLIDRLSFQQFVGLSYNEEIPDFTTIWKFKEALVKMGLMDGIFNAILSQLEAKGLIVRKGTMIDAIIIQSGKNWKLSRVCRSTPRPGARRRTARSILVTRDTSASMWKAKSFANALLPQPMYMTRRRWRI